MDEVKINGKGQITIPKGIREKYRLAPGTSLILWDIDGKLTLKPLHTCHACGRALSEEEKRNGHCPNCPVPIMIKVY